jgi:hypothetical protein
MQACCGERGEESRAGEGYDSHHRHGETGRKKIRPQIFFHFSLCRMKKTDQPSLIHPVARRFMCKVSLHLGVLQRYLSLITICYLWCKVSLHLGKYRTILGILFFIISELHEV